MKGKGRWILLALAVAGALYWWIAGRGGDGTIAGMFAGASRQRVERVVPESLRIRVEILNATTMRGLARQATFHLRDLGFDVVGSGNSDERLDSSVVIVRSGREDWGVLAAQALGTSRVEVRPDSSRYLDLTILLGISWRPPPESFHP